jgi:hypothetical protein
MSSAIWRIVCAPLGADLFREPLDYSRRSAQYRCMEKAQTPRTPSPEPTHTDASSPWYWMQVWGRVLDGRYDEAVAQLEGR